MSAPRIFFTFGLPKSGTTFLQRMLNAHPEVACPPEHNLELLRSMLHSVKTHYASQLAVLDRRTGGQGLSPLGDIVTPMMKSAITSLAEAAARGKPVFGLSDNSLIDHAEWYSSLLDHPPMIAIVRNPIDQGLSAWRHNHRLAEEESDPSHLSMFDAAGGGLEGWLGRCAELFTLAVDHYLRLAQSLPNLLIVTYEELAGAQKSSILQRMLRHLDLPDSEAVLRAMVEGSTLERMAESSAHPEFFGLGATRFGEGQVSAATRTSLLQRCASDMEKLKMPYPSPL